MEKEIDEDENDDYLDALKNKEEKFNWSYLDVGIRLLSQCNRTDFDNDISGHCLSSFVIILKEESHRVRWFFFLLFFVFFGLCLLYRFLFSKEKCHVLSFDESQVKKKRNTQDKQFWCYCIKELTLLLHFPFLFVFLSLANESPLPLTQLFSLIELDNKKTDLRIKEEFSDFFFFHEKKRKQHEHKCFVIWTKYLRKTKPRRRKKFLYHVLVNTYRDMEKFMKTKWNEKKRRSIW